MERHRVCPDCGSKAFRQAEYGSNPLVNDRIRKECGAKYTPPTPNWMAGAGIIVGVFGFLAVVIGSVGLYQGGRLDDLATDEPLIVAVMIGAIAVSLICIIAGIRHFRRY